jgi:hypothetical protein
MIKAAWTKAGYSFLSRPEINCVQNNQNEYQNTNHLVIPEHRLWLWQTNN